MKKFVLFIALSLTGFLFGQNTIYILGKTNVNSFKCTNSNLPHPTIKIRGTSFALPDFNVEVDGFDCANKIMTKDFKATLKSDQYPTINIDFNSFNKTNTGKYACWANVTLMNRAKKYYFEFTLASNNQLIGSRTIKFSDFGIAPPKKIGGMIRVDDNLNLQFKLKVN